VIDGQQVGQIIRGRDRMVYSFLGAGGIQPH
jgi:hypothetical protein